MRFPKVQTIQPVSSTKSGIYLHFPYCLQKCHYCDFYSVGLDELGQQDFQHRLELYEKALFAELESRSRNDLFCQQSFDTVYFGGGTSSLMPPEMIHRILSKIRHQLDLDPTAEITLEGNPENLVSDYLQSLHEIGINRVNSGLQTYNATFLKDMNRFYETERYSALLDCLVNSPIPSVGVDLIYGFHGQTYQDFLRDLDRIIQYPIQHLSVYSLTVEPETRYARNIRRGAQKAPEEDLQGMVFRHLPDYLAEPGFDQYEVSNFGKQGAFCKHNWKYWQYRPYLGLGPGAHGFNGRKRYANPRNLNAWTANPQGNPTEMEDHDPVIDLFLNLFRITVPINLDRVREVWTEAQWPGNEAENRFQLLLESLEHIQAKGEGQLHRSASALHFQWTMDGLLQLDSNVEYLVSQVLEESATTKTT